MTISTEPIIRPTYMQTKEVLQPHIHPIDITRTPDYTLITVHPGSNTPQVIQEIGVNLDSEGELVGWVHPFTDCAIDLRALHRDPLGYLLSLNPALTRIPCLAPYIPPPLRAPWLYYN